MLAMNGLKGKVRLGLCATAMVLLCGAAQARDLTVVMFGGLTQDAERALFMKPFSEKIGKPVLDEAWDGGFGVLQAKVKTGNPNWDVVQVESDDLALGCADGIFEKLDWNKLGGRDAFIKAGVSDCGAGHIVWSTVVSYNGDKLKGDAPNSWADFWDVKKYPGKRALRRSPKVALEAALMADGVAPDKVYEVLSQPGGVDRAFAKLDELRPNIVWWESAAQPLSMLQTGDVTMATVYNGRITALNKTEGTHLKTIWNQSIYAVDSLAILKGAENKDDAMDFVAFISAPENLSKLANYVSYGFPVKKAADLVPPDLARDLPTYPDNLKVALNLDVDFWIDNAEELTKRFNAWAAQ